MSDLKRRYGPFKGYVSSVDRHLVPLNALASDSYNYEVFSTDGRVRRRRGSQPISAVATGILESQWGAKCSQIFALVSPSMTDGYPAIAALYGHEADLEGAIYVRSSNGAGSNYVLGKEYGTTHYLPRSTTSSGVFKVQMLWSEYNSGTLTRLSSAALRKVLGGARRVESAGDWLVSPGGRSTPIMWNRRFNDSSSSGTEVNCVRAWGQYPPLFAPTISVPAAVTKGPWEAGDQFFVSVMFLSEENAPTPYKFPRGPNSVLTTGLGLVTLPGTRGTDFYDYIDWLNIAIAPRGYTVRATLRSDKVDSTNPAYVAPNSAPASAENPSGLKLVPFGILRNNTQTTFRDTGGNDESLTMDELKIRADHVWPQRGRYVFSNDARTIVCGKLKPNPGALILAPTGVNTTRDLNGADTQAPGSSFFYARVDATNLELKKDAGGAVTKTTIALSGKSIQDLVDSINATTVASAGGEWAAEVVPGADPSALATNLMVTTAFTSDDANVSDATTGNVRCFFASQPQVLYFSKTYMDTFDTDEQGLMFTGAGPLHPHSSFRNFYFDNRRRPPNRAVGRCMGGAAQGELTIIGFENAVYAFKRPTSRVGGTDYDRDYSLFPINEKRGVISPYSWAVGDGWVGYMTADGFAATNGEREIIISRDVWDAAALKGSWNFEVATSQASAASDGDSFAAFAHVLSNKLRVNYRTGASLPDRALTYDYSANQLASGLEEIVTPDGPFGWGSPTQQTCGAMGTVVKAGGQTFYTAVDSNEGTADGRIDQIEVGNDDNGALIQGAVYCATDLGETLYKKSAQRVWIVYKKDFTGLVLNFCRTKNRLQTSQISLPSTSGAVFNRLVCELPQVARSLGEVMEVFITDTGASVASEIFFIELEADVASSVEV